MAKSQRNLKSQTELFTAGFDRTDRAIALVEMLKAATHAPEDYFSSPVLIRIYSSIISDELNKARDTFDRLALQSNRMSSKVRSDDRST